MNTVCDSIFQQQALTGVFGNVGMTMGEVSARHIRRFQSLRLRQVRYRTGLRHFRSRRRVLRNVVVFVIVAAAVFYIKDVQNRSAID